MLPSAVVTHLALAGLTRMPAVFVTFAVARRVGPPGYFDSKLTTKSPAHPEPNPLDKDRDRDRAYSLSKRSRSSLEIELRAYSLKESD
jgi:hypothetical protein